MKLPSTITTGKKRQAPPPTTSYVDDMTHGHASSVTTWKVARKEKPNVSKCARGLDAHATETSDVSE